MKVTGPINGKGGESPETTLVSTGPKSLQAEMESYEHLGRGPIVYVLVSTHTKP